MTGISFADLLQGWQEKLSEVGVHPLEVRPKSPAVSEPEEAPSTKTRSATLKEWQRLLAALQESESELPYLKPLVEQLEAMLSRAEDLGEAQAALTAIKAGTAKHMSVLLADCQRLVTVLRLSVKHHYGPTADKLETFGIQPFRGRKRAEKAG